MRQSNNSVLRNVIWLDFYVHFLFYVFLGPQRYQKHKKFGDRFFLPPDPFFWSLENRQPRKIGKKSESTKMINGTTFHMFLGSRNLKKLLFWWSEVSFCHKGHLKVIWGPFHKNSLPLDFHGHFLILVFLDPLGSIKHKKLAAQFFWPPSVFLRPLDNRKPPKIG